MDLFDLYATLTLDTGDYESSISGASSATSLFASAASTAIGTLVSNAVTAVTSKIKELATELVDLGMETEEAFAKLETISGSENIDALTDSLTSLSNETGIASSELAETAYQAISAGTSAEDAAEMVETASKLATAGFTDSTTAVDVLTTAINAYGYSSEEATYLADTLITTQNLGKTTVDELASSIGRAIASGSAFNVSLENIEAAYVGLTAQGIGTAEATTYMSSMIKELGDSSSDVATILKEETGQSFSQLMDSGYSLSDVLQILYDNVNGDSTALQNLWSSAEAGMASNALVNNGLENFNETLLAIASSAGTTEEAYETMTNTLSYKTSVLTAVGQNLMLAIYDGMSEKLGTVVEFATDILSSFYDAYTADGFSGVYELGINTLNNLSQGVSEAIPTLAEQALSAVLSFSESLKENAGNLIDAALELVVQLAQGIADSLPTLIEYVPQIVTNIANIINENAPKLLVTAGEILLTLGQGLIDAIPTLVANIPQIIEAVIAVFTATNWINVGASIITAIKNGITSVATTIPTAVKEIGSTAKEWLSAIDWKTLGSDLIDLICIGIESLATSIPSALESIGKEGLNLIKSIDWLSLGENIVAGIVDGITGLAGDAAEAISGIGDTILSTFKSFFGISSPSTVMSDQGEYMVEGLISGIEDMPSQVSKYLSSVLSEVTTWGSDMIAEMSSAGSGSLSNVMSYINQMPLQLLTPLNSAISNATSFGTTLASKMTIAGSTALTNITSQLSQMPSKVLTQLNKVTSYASSWGSSLTSSFKSIGQNVMSGLISGISSMVSSLYSSIKNSLSGLVSTAKSALGISSPSKVFAEIGGYMAEGLDSGWSDEIESVKDKVAEDLEFEAGSILTSATASSGFETEMAIVEALNAKFDQLMLVLEEYFPQFADIKMYLDGDTLVAETAEQMDIALGKVAARKARMA